MRSSFIRAISLQASRHHHDHLSALHSPLRILPTTPQQRFFASKKSKHTKQALIKKPQAQPSATTATRSRNLDSGEEVNSKEPDQQQQQPVDQDEDEDDLENAKARGHIPVLLKEVVESLNLRPGGVYVDCTFGLGGYSKAILEACPGCKVFGIDRDASVSAPFANALASQFGKDRFTFVHGRFGDMRSLLERHNVRPSSVMGIVFDLGVSSVQLDKAERGFSFRQTHHGPLDMRMDTTETGSSTAETAADVVNRLSEVQLTRIIREYGEDKYAREIARAIVRARTSLSNSNSNSSDATSAYPINTTEQLAEIIRSALPKHYVHTQKKDVCTRTFQAIRIYINDELQELRKALLHSEALLGETGRLCVVSYHSKEDRLAKQFIQYASEVAQPSFTKVTKKVITPTEAEIEINPRSRSAKMRVAERTRAPPTVASDVELKKKLEDLATI